MNYRLEQKSLNENLHKAYTTHMLLRDEIKVLTQRIELLEQPRESESVEIPRFIQRIAEFEIQVGDLEGALASARADRAWYEKEYARLKG